MSTNHHRTRARVTGLILAMLLGPLATVALATPATAAGSATGGPGVSNGHWHCRLLPILC